MKHMNGHEFKINEIVADNNNSKTNLISLTKTRQRHKYK